MYIVFVGLMIAYGKKKVRSEYHRPVVPNIFLIGLSISL